MLNYGAVLTLVVAVSAGVLGLAMLFLREWTKRLARQALDKELEEHRHRLQMQADAIRLDQQRQLRDFDLFTQKRHRAYAGMYRRLLEAEGSAALLWGGRAVPTFEDYTQENVTELLASRKFPGQTVSEVMEAWNRNKQEGIERLNAALRQWEQQEAARRVQLARNYQLLRELYFSPTVRDAVQDAYKKLSDLTIELRYFGSAHGFPDDRPTNIPQKKVAVQSAITNVRDLMQAELQRGDYVAATPVTPTSSSERWA